MAEESQTVFPKSLNIYKKFNEVKQYRELVEIMLNVQESEQLDKIFEECVKYFHFDPSLANQKILKSKLKKFRTTFRSKWQKYRRIFTIFQKYEEQWLNNYITVPETWFSISTQIPAQFSNQKRKECESIDPDHIPGQRKKFKDLSKRGKQKAIQKTAQQFDGIPTAVLLKSAEQVLSKRGENSASLILKMIQKQCPSEMLSKLKSKEVKTTPCSSSEALALALEIDTSQKNYKLLRKY